MARRCSAVPWPRSSIRASSSSPGSRTPGACGSSLSRTRFWPFSRWSALVRSWGVSRTGATIAGLSYAFGGPVLSNYCNVIYLVGAAWAPLGFRAADRWLRLGRRSGLPELTLVLAMQVLGGDPEAAYLTVLFACVYAFGLLRAENRSPPRPWLWGLTLIVVSDRMVRGGSVLASKLQGAGGRWSQVVVATAWVVGVVVYGATQGPQCRGRMMVMFLGLAGSCLLAIAVTAAQLLPVLEQAAMSVRWSNGRSVDLYDFSLLPYLTVGVGLAERFRLVLARRLLLGIRLASVRSSPGWASVVVAHIVFRCSTPDVGFRRGRASGRPFLARLDDSGRCPELTGERRRVLPARRSGWA